MLQALQVFERRHGSVSLLFSKTCMIRWLSNYWLARRAGRLARKLERERWDRGLQAQRDLLEILFPPEERRTRHCGHDHRRE